MGKISKNINKKEVLLKKIEELYPEKFTEINQNLQRNRRETFRINLKLISEEKLLEKLLGFGIKIQKGPFPLSYIVTESNQNLRLSQTGLADDGSIYIQGFSSMLSPFILNPHENENILDACAAPGSKTSYCAALSNGKANITAVESNSTRFHLLKKVLSDQGFQNIETIKTNIIVLPKIRPGLINHFNKIICDVPCSNEGLIRDFETNDFTFWNPKLAKKLSMLQKRILAASLCMLKKRGTLIYSTCTYSIEENERVVEWALKKFKDIKLMKIDYFLSNSVPGFNGLHDTLRILPNEEFDGFFIAKFFKN